MGLNWIACNGKGKSPIGVENSWFNEKTTPLGVSLSRRGLLVGAALGLCQWGMRKSAFAQAAIGVRQQSKKVLVSIFLRGGMDGLNAVIPYGDDWYHRSRPTLRIAEPSALNGGAKAIDLDGYFGLHPALSPLTKLFREGDLAIVHAAGSRDDTRSHFEAMATMERGLEKDPSGIASGWLARHLQETRSSSDSPLRAVALASTMPAALRGATHAMALESLDDFRLVAEGQDAAEFCQQIEKMYGTASDVVRSAGKETLAVLDSLRRIDPSRYVAQNGSIYPNSSLGLGMQQVACLIRAGIGLEAALLDHGGWDTHVAQDQFFGSNLNELAQSLASFHQDLGTEMENVTVLVQTEFGRRLEENTGLGTDHGHGGVMFMLGGNVKGGRVWGNWPGIRPEDLTGPGDLQVTTDYRTVLAEALEHHDPETNIGVVFPGSPSTRLGYLSKSVKG